jgi:hypothetical protein
MLQKFEMNEKEFKAAEKWEKSQLKKHKRAKRDPLTFLVTFTLTGIGLGVTVVDTTTGETKDVTDYDSW